MLGALRSCAASGRAAAGMHRARHASLPRTLPAAVGAAVRDGGGSRCSPRLMMSFGTSRLRVGSIGKRPFPSPCAPLQGGKAAAETLLQLREAGDFSAANTRHFERKWMQLFGHDFKLVRGSCLRIHPHMPACVHLSLKQCFIPMLPAEWIGG